MRSKLDLLTCESIITPEQAYCLGGIIMPERIILPKSELIYLSLISCESIKSKLSKMCRNKQRNTKPLTNI